MRLPKARSPKARTSMKRYWKRELKRRALVSIRVAAQKAANRGAQA